MKPEAWALTSECFIDNTSIGWSMGSIAPLIRNNWSWIICANILLQDGPNASGPHVLTVNANVSNEQDFGSIRFSAVQLLTKRFPSIQAT